MLFSIIVPYKNRATLLPRTLKSLANQHFRPVEVLLVDNGSSDDSPLLCEEFKKKAACADFRVRLLSCPTGGVCRARNCGLAAAVGEYAYFFDSDDEMSPRFLQDVQAVLSEKPEVVAARTTMVFENGAKKVRKVYKNSGVSDQILTAMLSTQSFVVKRDFLQRIGGWNEALPKWNDWELGVRMLCARPAMKWLSGTYHLIYQHPDSLTGRSLADTYALIRPALVAVSALSSLSPMDIRALNYRKTALAAQLARAEKSAEAKALWQEVTSCGRDTLLRFLYIYTLWGGRGGWWLFRTFSSII